MLYYIQLCSNECHVVVTNVTPSRAIATQGHSRWLLDRRYLDDGAMFLLPAELLPGHTCQTILLELCPRIPQAASPTGGASASRQGCWAPPKSWKISCFPFSDPHWSLWWSQAEWGRRQQWKGWVATLAKPCRAAPRRLQGYRLAVMGKADLSPKAGCKYTEVSRSLCQGVQWALGCISCRNDFGEVSLQSDTRTHN